MSVLDDPKLNKVLIFTQMKHVANKVLRKLDTLGISGTALHGNKSQSARTKALDGFKRGQFRVLVATDVAARGLDVDDITHVINYDLPNEAETYVHRIGRTARAGSRGDAISFCSSDERGQLRDIERLLGRSVPAELEHDFHCEDAFRATGSGPRKSPGGGGGGGGRGGQRRGNSGGGGQRGVQSGNRQGGNTQAKSGGSRGGNRRFGKRRATA
jgi:ATP-dependent RNA helicase RhlE